MLMSATEPQNDTLQLRDLSISYRTIYGGLKAVNKLNLTIKKGESVGIVGESGSGKSTLGLAITGLLPPNARYVQGDLFLDGLNVPRLSNKQLYDLRGTTVFMIFQDPLNSLNPVKRIRTQMLEALQVKYKREGTRFYEDRALKEGIDSLTDVRMPDPEQIINRYPHQLSGGQIQRVIIAMSLLMRPKLLIADEPTSALDVTVQAQVLKLMRDLQKNYGMSILFITHDISVAYAIADRLVVMYAGEISEMGPIEKVINNPLHPYVRGLLGSIPRKTKREGDLDTVKGSPPDMLNPPRGCRFHPRCPHVMDICKKKSPDFVEKDERHLRCFLYD
jgi:peptide/nickel transport system ATP-binding protein